MVNQVFKPLNNFIKDIYKNISKANFKNIFRGNEAKKIQKFLINIVKLIKNVPRLIIQAVKSMPKVVEELKIYQIAVKLRNEVYEDVNRITNNWKIKDIDQIKRSSSSVASNIAEGFGRRFYPKDYIRFLNLAIGSSDESQNHTDVLYKGGYFSKKRANYFKTSINIHNIGLLSKYNKQ